MNHKTPHEEDGDFLLGSGDLKNQAIAYLAKHDERADEQVKSLAQQNADLLARLAALEEKLDVSTKAKK